MLMQRPTTELGVLFGHLFEFYCLHKLAPKGRFPMRSLDEPGELCTPSNGAIQRVNLHGVISCGHGYLQIGKWKTFSLKAASHTDTTSFLRHLASLSSRAVSQECKGH